MSKLIKNGRIVNDAWKTLTLAEGDTPQSVRLPVGPVLVRYRYGRRAVPN